MEALGIKTSSAYQQWCSENGFPMSLEKSYKQMSKERKHSTKQKALDALKLRNPKKLKHVVDEIKSGAKTNSFYMDDHRNIAMQYTNICTNYWKEYGDTYLDFILYLDGCSKLVEDKRMSAVISELIINKDHWIRSFNGWVPKSKNVYKQVSSLIRHLMAKYDVPLFMDEAWLKTNASKDLQREWFLHIASGKNIRTANKLPFPLTKKEAHNFLQTPNECSIDDAFFRSQIITMGGSDRLFNSLRGNVITRISNNEKNIIFRKTVYQFFIDRPMLDLAQASPICDYIHNQKFVTQQVAGRNGQPATIAIPQPNFSMNGRTAEALMDNVERWHKQLGREKKGGARTWEHSPIADFELQYGTAQKRNLRYWRIIEQKSSKELSALGRKLSNCVASYAHSCERGSCSIWALSYEQSFAVDERLAIEVTRQKQITQVRGKLNRVPTKIEGDIIAKWAQKQGLSFSSYLRGF